MKRRTFLTTGLTTAGIAAATAPGFAAESATNRNKSVARRFTEEVWGRHNAELLNDVVSPDFLNHDPFPGTDGNREGEREALVIHRKAMGNPEAHVDDQIAEGDKVATRWTLRATHKGEFLGIAPTGKRVTISGINICRIKDGKIAELWRKVDVMSLMQQLGAVSQPAKKK